MLQCSTGNQQNLCKFYRNWVIFWRQTMLSTTETDLDRAEDAGYPGSVKSFEIIDPSRTLSYRVCLCSAVSSKGILSIMKTKSNPVTYWFKQMVTVSASCSVLPTYILGDSPISLLRLKSREQELSWIFLLYRIQVIVLGAVHQWDGFRRVGKQDAEETILTCLVAGKKITFGTQASTWYAWNEYISSSLNS